MGMSSRRFLINNDGAIFRISNSRFDRMMRHPEDERIPSFAGQRIRCADAVIELVDRIPYSICRETFAILEFDNQGCLDTGRFEKQQVALIDTMLEPVLGRDEIRNNVVDATQRFVAQGGSWSPSKEGHSARWVYAALCDLRGSFQARDLVRFFKFAAQEELKNRNVFWADRVLSPEAMRRAILECSRQKVEEATKEIAPLRAWNERMNDRRILEKPIPVSAVSVALESSELAVLRELGVIYEDLDPALGDKRVFLPEIYRAGLGFDLSGGRPRIQALLKKNLGKMPF